MPVWNLLELWKFEFPGEDEFPGEFQIDFLSVLQPKSVMVSAKESYHLQRVGQPRAKAKAYRVRDIAGASLTSNS